MAVLALSLLALIACGQPSSGDDGAGDNNLDFSVGNSKSPRLPDDTQAPDPSVQGYENFASAANTYSLSEEITVLSSDTSLKFSRVSFTVSDKLPSNVRTEEVYQYLETEAINENGTLINGDVSSFYIVTMTITNFSESDDLFYLSSCQLALLDARNELMESCSLNYRSGYRASTDDPQAKRYAETVLKSGEDEEFTLIYIVRDDLLAQSAQVQLIPASTRSLSAQAFVLK